MSFSGTPLGQDRRLDHQTFLKGGFYPKAADHRRFQPINPAIPLSYAYGAPRGSAVHSHSPPHSPELPTAEVDDEERTVRYSHLKQRNQTLANRPGPSLGPGVITTPPQPTPASAKDTSVNIASAFHQALNTMASNESNNSWTSGRQNLPRSTSVEYEQQAQNTSHRRLAKPPSRIGSKPPSRSAAHVRGSDAENDHSGEPAPANGRGKSPFEHLSDLTSRAVSSATFLMRQRSQEPEDLRPPSRQATDKTLVPENGNSYDYADEEEEYQEMSKKPASTVHRRNRISLDNKAYKPTNSDLEDESEEDSQDERKGRRRRKKKELGGGPLRSLPVTQYDKRKRRRGRDGRPGEEDGSFDEQEEQEAHAEQQRLGSVAPIPRQTPVPRGSVPPPARGSVPPAEMSKNRSFNSMNETMDIANIENGLLQSIPEVDEQELPEELSKSFSRKRRPRSRSRSRTRPKSPFSIGALLGSLVNMVYRFGHTAFITVVRAIATVALMFGKATRTILDIFVFHPIILLRRQRGISTFAKFLAAGLFFYLVVFALRNSSIIGLTTSVSRTPYVAPELPPGTLDGLIARLLKLENTLADIQSDSIAEKDRLDVDLRRTRDVASRVNQLESRIDKEAIRSQKLQEDATLAASKGIEHVAREIRALQSQQTALPPNSHDDEAREKLRTLEERLGSVEGGMKEALELGQQALKAGSVATGAASSHWWNKLGSGPRADITIKSSDGQDLTSIFGSLIDHALMVYDADRIGRRDYALSSGGAFVIPSLTSETYMMRSSYLFGLVSGSAIYSRSPVTALHHETTPGYCWRMATPQGHLGVKLSEPVRVTDVTIDHAQSVLAYDIRVAPRHMEVWALVEGADNLEKWAQYRARRDMEREQAIEEGAPYLEDPAAPEVLKNGEYMRIASFMYNIHAPNNVQSFPILEEVKELGMDFGVVVLFVNSNWGQEESTCLYRFRIHGDRIAALPEPDP